MFAYATALWACPTDTHFAPHRHYCLVLDVIGCSLLWFESSYEMVSVVHDAIIGEIDGPILSKQHWLFAFSTWGCPWCTSPLMWLQSCKYYHCPWWQRASHWLGFVKAVINSTRNFQTCNTNCTYQDGPWRWCHPRGQWPKYTYCSKNGRVSKHSLFMMGIVSLMTLTLNQVYIQLCTSISFTMDSLLFLHYICIILWMNPMDSSSFWGGGCKVQIGL